MIRNKKAQGLTLNTVVIAVLVLIVLAILIFIAYKYIYGAGTSIGELSGCKAQKKGAHCGSSCDENEDSFYRMGGCGGKDYPDDDYCCIPNTDR